MRTKPPRGNIELDGKVQVIRCIAGVKKEKRTIAISLGGERWSGLTVTAEPIDARALITALESAWIWERGEGE